MNDESHSIGALDYFSGGVPNGIHFKGTLDDIEAINKAAIKTSGIDRLSELCYVGILSYFEAFCKDHAATLISLCPHLIGNLRISGHSISVDPYRALQMGQLFPAKIGFLTLEGVDFGGAKKINSIYEALIKVSPFSKDNARFYEGLLRDRNLIVHHGSVYTSKYIDQNHGSDGLSILDAYFNSLVINQVRVVETIDFIRSVSKKLMASSHKAIIKICSDKNIKLDAEKTKALEFCGEWD